MKKCPLFDFYVVLVVRGKDEPHSLPPFTLVQGGEPCEYSASGPLVVCYQIDCYVKKCLRNEVRNINKAKRTISEHEVLFSELPQGYMERFYSDSEKDILLHTFQALHYSVSVENDRLSEALLHLPEEKRRIILLFYFLDMTDLEISELTHTKQSRIKKTRQRTLKDLRRNMEVRNDKTKDFYEA